MSSTAKLFMHGRSQAVRLPKEFRFEGTEVRISKVGDKVILEPAEKKPFDAAAWRAKLEEYRDIPFMEEVAIRTPSSTMTRLSRSDLHRHQCRDRSAPWPASAGCVPTRPLPAPLAGAVVVCGVHLREPPTGISAPICKA